MDYMKETSCYDVVSVQLCCSARGASGGGDPIKSEELRGGLCGEEARLGHLGLQPSELLHYLRSKKDRLKQVERAG